MRFGDVCRRHPGAGRDPVDAKRQPVSFDIITQVLRSAKLDTARPRYDGGCGGAPPAHRCGGSDEVRPLLYERRGGIRRMTG